MKRILCFVLAIAMLAMTALVLTGCNNNNKTEETTAPTQPATQKPTVWQPTDRTTTKSTDATEATGATGSGSGTTGVSQEAAMDMAVKQFTGCYVNGIYEGTDPQGNKAWVLLMLGEDGNEFTAYVSGGKAYTADGAGSEASTEQSTAGDSDTAQAYAGHTETDAITLAIADTGSDYTVTETYKGYNTAGEACWVIHLTSPEGESFISYVTADGATTHPA